MWKREHKKEWNIFEQGPWPHNVAHAAAIFLLKSIDVRQLQFWFEFHDEFVHMPFICFDQNEPNDSFTPPLNGIMIWLEKKTNV